MNNLEWLERWYQNNCNGEWEHFYGVEIGTLDNPGWYVKVDLRDTIYSEKKVLELDNDSGDSDWIKCSIINSVFNGCGDYTKLNMIIQTFRQWIEG